MGKKEEINDFGFTFQSETDYQNIDKSKQLYEMITTFLENLKGSEESDIINWPGTKRHEQIDAFIEKLTNTLEK